MKQNNKNVSFSSKVKTFLYDRDWIPYPVYNFIVDWIFPAYKTRRFFNIDRYDIVKCGVKRFEYADTRHRILHANMNLLCEFVENGNLDMACYNEIYKNIPYLPFGEFEEKDIININLNENCSVENEIKEIYQWWKIDRPKMEDEQSYFLNFWYNLFCFPIDQCIEKCKDSNNFLFLNKKKNPTFTEIKNSVYFKPEYIYKYLTDDDLTNEKKVNHISDMLEERIEYFDRKMLSKLMEIREYVWEP